MKKTIFYLLLSLCFAGWGCSEKDEPEPEVESRIELVDKAQKDLIFDSDGASTTVHVYANKEWTSSVNADWIKLSPEKGLAGEKISVNISVEGNETTDERRAEVVLSCGSESSVKINIVQSQKDKLKLDSERIEIGPEAQTVSVTVGHNVDYEIVTDAEWISQKSTKGYVEDKLSFEIQENEIPEERTGTIRFVPTLQKKLEKSLTIVQAPGEKVDEETRQRNFLVKLYNDAGGEEWSSKENWLSDEPLDRWYGISFEGSQMVISLESNGLKGSIDLSGGEFISSIYLGYNELESIKLEDCFSLRLLHCFNNNLKELVLTACSSLVDLNCNSNKIERLNVGDCASLEFLYCSDNEIGELDVKGFESLKEIHADENNKMKTLSVSDCSVLKDIDCSLSSSLEKLNLKSCPNLSSLNFSYCNVGSLELTSCPNIYFLYCTSNQLEQLNLSSCGEIGVLSCGSNSNLKKLDVKHMLKLTKLDCSYSSLKEIDVSGLLQLSELNVEGNKLESIKVDGCSSLMRLYCGSNENLKELNIDGLQSSLKYLKCRGTAITKEIPLWFDKLYKFKHDARYDYSGETWKDRGFGWWYPGEPESGKHRRTAM